jgi:hypothetical protein
MSGKHLLERPHDINKVAWWYEENSGICFVHEIRDNSGVYQRTVQYTIPWCSIRAALARKDRRP